MAWVSHLEKLYKFLKEVRALVSNTEQNQREIRDLQGELREVAELLQELMFELKRMDDRSRSQRENDKLRMENFKLQVEVLLGKSLSEGATGGDNVRRLELKEPVGDSSSPDDGENEL